MKTQTKQSLVSIVNNAFEDKGSGVISFPNGLTITDNTEQWSGTKYDIESLDVKSYSGKLTADHSSSIEKVLGKVKGITKIDNKRVSIKGIQFAINDNALARYAYNMIKAEGGPYLTDFSIESIGEYPDEEGVYHNHAITGLSLVVTGNNKSANFNQVVLNSIQECKENDIDSEDLESLIEQNDSGDVDNIDTDISNVDNDTNDMKYVTINNSKSFAVTVTFKNAAGLELTKILNANESVDVSEDQKETVEKQIEDAQEPKVEVNVEKEVENAVAPLLKELNDIKKTLANNNVETPGFKEGQKSTNVNKNEVSGMDRKSREHLQLQSMRDMLVSHSPKAAQIVYDINQFHLDELKKSGKVDNAITISDMGNYVLSPEQLTEIEGFRSNFQPFLARTNWRQTLSLSMAYIARNGDIDMQGVEFCDDGEDGNLKPISEYGATIKTSELEELAAVTPVCNAATRFLAVDLLEDVAEGYRTDYDRKRAQLVIARLQQAVNETGNRRTVSAATTLGPLNTIIDAAGSVAEQVENGLWIFSYSTYYQLLKYRLGAGVQTDAGFDLFTTGDNGAFVGLPYQVVPNELMPALNSAQTRSFQVNGETVTINNSMFLADLTKFKGRTSGGLNYDMSTDAAYETGEGENRIVKSAYQRNELVLRGSFFRGGAFTDPSRVAGVAAAAIS